MTGSNMSLNIPSTPHPQPHRWHSWDEQDIEVSPTDRELEHDLGWPRRTLAVLRKAFTLNLDRYTGWDCPAQPEFVCAAHYFKRGVALHSSAKNFPAVRCIIEFVSDLTSLQPTPERFVLCDAQVHTQGLLTCTAPVVTIEATEQKKKLATVAYILRQWRKNNCPQHWTIIGGGVTLDVCAFAAAIVGACIELIPTTLVAMIDAGIGGKTGVNFPPWGKNQIGVFYFPAKVLICPQWLQTLPARELQAGSWECIKHAIITGDAKLLANFKQGTYSLELLRKIAAVKIALVKHDPYENGARKKLNFGHTLAHALEAISHQNTPILHGEAVGIGMIYAILLSKRQGKIKKLPHYFPDLSVSHALLSRQELFTRLGSTDTEQLWNEITRYLKQDKKRHITRQWVLLSDTIHPLPQVQAETVHVDEETLRECLASTY